MGKNEDAQIVEKNSMDRRDLIRRSVMDCDADCRIVGHVDIAVRRARVTLLQTD